MRRCRSSKMWKWKTPESFDSQSPIRSHIKAAARNLGGLFLFPQADDNRSAQGSSLIPTRSASKDIHSVQSLAGASAWYLPDQLLKANAFCESLRIMSFPVRLDPARQTPEPREGQNWVWSHFLTAQGRRAIQPGGLAENSRWQAPRRRRNSPDPGNSPRRGDRKLHAHRRPKDSLATPRTPSRQRPASRGHPSPRGWQKSCHRREK